MPNRKFLRLGVLLFYQFSANYHSVSGSTGTGVSQMNGKNLTVSIPTTTTFITYQTLENRKKLFSPVPFDDGLSGVIEVFDNGTSSELEKQIEFGDGNRKYRKRYGWGGHAYASGSSGESYGGGASFANAGGYGGGGFGWKKGKNNHYNPSVNKFGGGGPISYNPKGNTVPKVPNYGGIGKGESGGGVGGSGGAGTGVSLPEEPIHIVTCDLSEKCHAFTHCAYHSFDYLVSKERCCIQPIKQHKGICCDGNYPKVPSNPGSHFHPYSTDSVQVPDISQSSLQTGASRGYDYKVTYASIENRLLELNLIVERGTAAHGHLQFFQTTPAMLNIARENFLVIKATNYIQDTYFLSNAEAGIGLQAYDFGGTVFEKTCPAVPKCDRFAKYRAADGSCNNPTSPKLAQSSTPLLRLLPPDYADGVWAPRVRKDGSPLPGARFITLALVPDANIPDPRYSHLVMQFGQFVDHDMSHVPIFRYGDMSGIQCCSNTKPEIPHPACFPIEIPPNDFHHGGQPCLNFVRSMTAPRLDCTFGHADQLNQLSHWLDASQIYGNTFEQAEALREFSGGRLRITRDNSGREFLPEDGRRGDRDCAQAATPNGHCYLAGDKRVNEQVGLTSLHTIFLREHNRIAFELGTVNPLWDDEILYQETRRIVIAEYEHIIYNEFLPIIIGRKYMGTFGILPLYSGYYNGYDSGVDARVSNSFTTAAFRMGHSLVQGVFNLQANGRGNGRLLLRNFFNNPSILPEPGVLDGLTGGLITQSIQRFDNFVTTELRDHLFETASSPGMDLIALNIQRGRDHGLPSYNEYRDLCRIGKARDFGDLSPVIHPRKIPQLENIYGNVDDIDLFIGGIYETPLPGAVVGPTFACIIGDQFVRSKRGDSFFYDIGGQPHSFNLIQLHEIRSASMSRILCDNSDEIRIIQPLAFHLPNGGYNPMLPCGSPAIPRLNLRHWREDDNLSGLPLTSRT